MGRLVQITYLKDGEHDVLRGRIGYLAVVNEAETLDEKVAGTIAIRLIPRGGDDPQHNHFQQDWVVRWGEYTEIFHLGMTEYADE